MFLMANGLKCAKFKYDESQRYLALAFIMKKIVSVISPPFVLCKYNIPIFF